MTEQKLQEQKEQGTPARETPKYLWRSGELVEWESATVHVSMLGWTAVSAIFEGIRAYWNPDRQELYIFRLAEHLKRMLQSMKLMRMASPYSTEDLAQAIISLLRDNEYRRDVYIQPLAYFGEGIPGYMAVLERPGEVVITARPAPSGLGESKVSHCNVSSWTRISDNVMPPRVKAITNYQNSRYISTEATINGYDFGIALNQNGKVTEASYACIYIVRDGVAITPPASAGILESITSDTVKRLLEKEMGTSVQERDVDRTELYIADEAFVCGTAVEIQPIGSVDRYSVGDGEVGPVVSGLRELFHNVVRGANPGYSNWLTPVYSARV
jgi:branched-chain amino acid aminotransferase